MLTSLRWLLSMLLIAVVGCNQMPDYTPDAGSSGDAGGGSGWPVMPGMPAYAWTSLNCPDNIFDKEVGTVEILVRDTPCLFQHRTLDVTNIPDGGQIQIQLFNFPPRPGKHLRAQVSAYLVINGMSDYHDAPKVDLGSWNDDQAFHFEFTKPSQMKTFSPVFEITVSAQSDRYVVDGFYIYEYHP